MNKKITSIIILFTLIMSLFTPIPLWAEAPHHKLSTEAALADPRFTPLDYSIEEINGTTLLYYEQDNKSGYALQLAFDLTVVPPEDLPYVRILMDIFGRRVTHPDVPAELPDPAKLTVTGTCYRQPENGNLDPRMLVRTRFTEENLPTKLSVLKEILLHHTFEDAELLASQINRLTIEAEIDFITRADHFAALRADSYLDAPACYQDRLMGLESLINLQQLNQNFAQEEQSHIEKLQTVAQHLINRDQLLCVVAGPSEHKEEIKTMIADFLQAFPQEKQKSYSQDCPLKIKQEAVAIPTAGNFIALSVPLGQYQENLHGEELILVKLIQELSKREGFTREITAGESDSMGRFQLVTAYTPSVQSSLADYAKLVDFIAHPNLDEASYEDLLASLFQDHALSGEELVEMLGRRYLEGISNQQLQEQVDTILHTSLSEISQWAEPLSAAIQENNYAVFGEKKQLEAFKDHFSAILYPFSSEDFPDKPRTADPQDPLLGTWQVREMSYQGESLSAEDATLDLQFIFLPDGTMQMVQDQVVIVSQIPWYAVVAPYYRAYADEVMFLTLQDEEQLTMLLGGVLFQLERVHTEYMPAAEDPTPDGEEDKLTLRDELDPGIAIQEVIALGDGNFQYRELAIADVSAWLEQQEKVVLLDFWADWCSPCRRALPVLDALAESHTDVLRVIKINVDVMDPALADHFSFLGIPALFLVKSGEILWQQEGFMPGKTEDAIENALTTALTK